MATPIKEIIHKVLEKRNDNSARFKLMTQWQEIVGADLARYVKLEVVKDDMLVLGVLNASWLQEMYCMSTTLLETINSALVGSPIKKLHFKQIAPVKKQQINPYLLPNKLIDRGSISPAAQLTLEEKNILSRIVDVDIRASVEKIFLRAHTIRILERRFRA
jgi:hypothetical protein